MTGRPWEQRLILESTIRSHENTGSTSSQEGEQLAIAHNPLVEDLIDRHAVNAERIQRQVLH